MKKIFSILTFLFIFCGGVLGQQKSVAVYIVGRHHATTDLEGALIKELSSTGKFRIADRSDAVQAILAKEFSVQSSGAVDFDQIMKLGKQIGAEYLLVANLDYNNYNHYTKIVAKLINVEENSVVASADWYGILINENVLEAGYSIVRDMLRIISPNSNNSSNSKNNSKKPVFVGPLTYQEAMDYEIPKGYSTFKEGANRGFTPSEVINQFYDDNIAIPINDRLVISRYKTKSNNRVSEVLVYMHNRMQPFGAYDARSYKASDLDYYTYCFGSGVDLKRESYTLEFDKKGNFRYIDIEGKKKDKNFIPKGYYYIILLPDD